MNTESTLPNADHRPYIEAVRSALLADDIRVGAATFSTGAVRSAAMPLPAPDDDADEPWHPTFADSERVQLRWSEEDGWSLLALHPSDEGQQSPTVWRHGLGVVHPPEAVRAWLALLLTAPAFAASRDDAPYRTHQHHDPDLESALTAYAL